MEEKMGENINQKGRDDKMEEMLSEILSELKDFRGEMRDVKADVRELKTDVREIKVRMDNLEKRQDKLEQGQEELKKGQEEIIKIQKEHSEQIEFILETVKSTDRILTQRRREQTQKMIFLDKVKLEKDKSQDKQIQENSERIAKCEEQIARLIK